MSNLFRRLLAWQNNLQGKFVFYMAACGLVPLLIIGISSLVMLTTTLEQSARELVTSKLDYIALSVQSDLRILSDLALSYSASSRFDQLTQPGPGETPKEVHNRALIDFQDNDTVAHFSYPLDFIYIDAAHQVYTRYGYSPVSGYAPLMERLTRSDWHRRLASAHQKSLELFTSDNLLVSRGGEFVYIAANVLKEYETCGLVIIGISTGYFAKKIRRMLGGGADEFFVCGADGQACLIAAGAGTLAFDDFLAAGERPSGGGLIHDNVTGRAYMAGSQRITVSDRTAPMVAAMVTPITDIQRRVSAARNLTILLVCAELLIIAALAAVTRRAIIRPVQRMSRMAAAVREGDLDVRVGIRGPDELGQLAEGLDAMVGQLQGQIEQIKRDGEEKRHMEQEALMAQIKPHFLKNALGAIRYMAEIKRAYGVSEALKSLSLFLDYLVYGSEDGRAVCSLQDELDGVKAYVHLQQLRFQNKFDCTYDIDDAALDCLVPKLCVQPIVENSIMHGFPRKSGQCGIHISARVDGRQLLVRIADDGVGMAASPKATSTGSGGVGLGNVHRRIQLEFGEGAGLQIRSAPGNGCTVTLVMGVRRVKEGTGHDPNADR